MAVKKKAKRKKKATSVVEAPIASKGEKTVSIRKIDNGWVIREEWTAQGRYMTKETFTKTKPVFQIKA